MSYMTFDGYSFKDNASAATVAMPSTYTAITKTSRSYTTTAQSTYRSCYKITLHPTDGEIICAFTFNLCAYAPSNPSQISATLLKYDPVVANTIDGVNYPAFPVGFNFTYASTNNYYPLNPSNRNGVSYAPYIAFKMEDGKPYKRTLRYQSNGTSYGDSTDGSVLRKQLRFELLEPVSTDTSFYLWFQASGTGLSRLYYARDMQSISNCYGASVITIDGTPSNYTTTYSNIRHIGQTVPVALSAAVEGDFIGFTGGYYPSYNLGVLQNSTTTNAWVYYQGAWRGATTYIYSNGEWKEPTPYIRSGSSWKPSE